MAIKEVVYFALMHTFFGILPYDVRQRLSDKDKQQLLEDLYTGSISPRLILFDE